MTKTTASKLKRNGREAGPTSKPSGGHHDVFFKACYSIPDFAFELFKMAFSKKELDAFDWSRLRAEKDTFNDPGAHGARADVVFSVPLKRNPKRKAKIFLLLEHKSRFTRWIYCQILKYKTLIISESLEKGDEDCLVIAVLLYNGEEPWRWPKSLKEGLWGRILPEIPSSLEKDALNYGIRVVDVSSPAARKAIADRSFKSRGFLSALKEARSLKPEEGELRKAISLFDNWTGDRDDLALNVGSYFWSSIPGMTKELWEKLERDAVRRGIFSKGGFMNVREYMKEEAREEVRQEVREEVRGEVRGEVRQEGRHEGRQEERQAVILNMLKEKLDASLIAKVTGLPEAEIIKFKNGEVKSSQNGQAE